MNNNEQFPSLSFILNRKKGYLILEDGSRFEGYSFGSEKNTSGECVFQTGMVGYPESLTDPSYCCQLLVLTYPLIGNYGVPPRTKDNYGFLQFYESNKIHVAALLVAEYSEEPSHWNCNDTLSHWLKEEGIPALGGLDTRLLTKKIRDRGSMMAKIVFDEKDIDKVEFFDINKLNLVDQVSTKTIQYYGEGDKTIVIIDCGMKLNQIRSFLNRGVRVKVVPWDYDVSQDKEHYDGVFISNGPGDPVMANKTVENVKNLIKVSLKSK